MCDMWLKFVGAEISFERRSVLLGIDLIDYKILNVKLIVYVHSIVLTYVRIVRLPSLRKENLFDLSLPSRSQGDKLRSSPESSKNKFHM